MMAGKNDNSKTARWVTLAALLALSLFMYVSITYKIIHYGP